MFVCTAALAQDADCAYLSQSFDLCAQGTPWAGGRWEQFGDGATLYLGDIGFDGFEDYFGRDDSKSIAEDLASVTSDRDPDDLVVPHLRDAFVTDDLHVERSIDTMTFGDRAPQLRVTMIGQVGSERIMMLVSAPAETALAEIEIMSRDYAALVRLRTKEMEGSNG